MPVFGQMWLSYFCHQQIDRQSALQTTQKENTNRTFNLTFYPHNHALKRVAIQKKLYPARNTKKNYIRLL